MLPPGKNLAVVEEKQRDRWKNQHVLDFDRVNISSKKEPLNIPNYTTKKN